LVHYVLITGVSQPGSRSGSRPPSRAGSNVSLDSTGKYYKLSPVKCIENYILSAGPKYSVAL